MRKTFITRLKIGITAICLAIFALYAFYEARNLLRGPVLQVFNPENGSTIQEPIVTIRGEAKNISRISLNDRQIFVDKDGVFAEKVALPNGYSALKIAVEDKFGRKEERIIGVVFNGTPATVARAQ